jgi:hypothetical protein
LTRSIPRELSLWLVNRFALFEEENAAKTCLTIRRKKAGQITVNGPTVSLKKVVEP